MASLTREEMAANYMQSQQQQGVPNSGNTVFTDYHDGIRMDDGEVQGGDSLLRGFKRSSNISAGSLDMIDYKTKQTSADISLGYTPDISQTTYKFDPEDPLHVLQRTEARKMAELNYKLNEPKRAAAQAAQAAQAKQAAQAAFDANIAKNTQAAKAAHEIKRLQDAQQLHQQEMKIAAKRRWMRLGLLLGAIIMIGYFMCKSSTKTNYSAQSKEANTKKFESQRKYNTQAAFEALARRSRS